MKILITRHAQTIENKKSIVCGQLPGTLSKTGKQQAEQLANRLHETQIDYIYSSDLKRAVDTTKEIIKYHPNTTIKYVSELREKHQGVFQGKPNQEVSTKSWVAKMREAPIDTAPKGGETKREVYNRVKKWFTPLRTKHKDDTVLIVTHGGVVKSLVCILNDKPAEELIGMHKFPNTSLTKSILNKHGQAKIELYNDTTHIQKIEPDKK